MDRIKTGGQSKGDRMAAVTRDGVSFTCDLCLQKEVKKKTVPHCVQREQREDQVPAFPGTRLSASIPLFFLQLSFLPTLSISTILYLQLFHFFSQWWSLKHPRPQVTASISWIYRCRGQSNQGPLQLTRVMVHMLLFITESVSADSPHYNHIYVLDCITHSHENVLPKEN